MFRSRKDISHSRFKTNVKAKFLQLWSCKYNVRSHRLLRSICVPSHFVHNKVQQKPLNVITLGQTKSENITRAITITDTGFHCTTVDQLLQFTKMKHFYKLISFAYMLELLSHIIHLYNNSNSNSNNNINNYRSPFPKIKTHAVNRSTFPAQCKEILCLHKNVNKKKNFFKPSSNKGKLN